MPLEKGPFSSTAVAANLFSLRLVIVPVYMHLVRRAYAMQHPDSDSAECWHPLATCGHGSLTDQPITDKRNQGQDVDNYVRR